MSKQKKEKLPTFDDIEKMLRGGGTWADVVERHGRPAAVCKKHGQVWCYHPGCEDAHK